MIDLKKYSLVAFEYEMALTNNKEGIKTINIEPLLESFKGLIEEVATERINAKEALIKLIQNNNESK